MPNLRLKDLREDADLKQEDVAKILGISRQYYSRYEQGQVELPIRHYITLARFYNVSIDFLSGAIDVPRSLDGRSRERKTELTAKELRLIEKYNAATDMQKAVDTLLGI